MKEPNKKQQELYNLITYYGAIKYAEGVEQARGIFDDETYQLIEDTRIAILEAINDLGGQQ